MSNFGQRSRSLTDAPGYSGEKRFSNFPTVFLRHKFLAKGSPDRAGRDLHLTISYCKNRLGSATLTVAVLIVIFILTLSTLFRLVGLARLTRLRTGLIGLAGLPRLALTGLSRLTALLTALVTLILFLHIVCHECSS
jgi:hypothetical protein